MRKRFVWKHKVLTFQAAFWLIVFRVGLSCMSFSKVTDWTVRITNYRKKESNYSLLDITRAISIVSRFIPKATSLTEVLAAYVLLACEGCSICMQMGVADDTKRIFVAHAWIEYEGKVVLDDHVQVNNISLHPALEGNRNRAASGLKGRRRVSGE